MPSLELTIAREEVADHTNLHEILIKRAQAERSRIESQAKDMVVNWDARPNFERIPSGWKLRWRYKQYKTKT